MTFATRDLTFATCDLTSLGVGIVGVLIAWARCMPMLHAFVGWVGTDGRRCDMTFARCDLTFARCDLTFARLSQMSFICVMCLIHMRYITQSYASLLQRVSWHLHDSLACATCHSYVSCVSFICMWHDSIICLIFVTRALIFATCDHTCLTMHLRNSLKCATCHSYVWCILFKCVTWLNHRSDICSVCPYIRNVWHTICMTLSNERHAIHMCDVSHSYVCDMTHSCVWRDSLMCVTQLFFFQMCDVSFICVIYV